MGGLPRVTTACLAYLAAHPPAALGHCISAGEPLNPSVIQTWQQKTGMSISDGYGQTETCIVVGNFTGEKVKEGSMGQVAPGYEVAVCFCSVPLRTSARTHNFALHRLLVPRAGFQSIKREKSRSILAAEGARGGSSRATSKEMVQ